MNMTTWTYRITPLAAALVVAMSLAACNKHESAEDTAAATTPPPATEPAATPPATPSDNTATASTTGDNTATAGTTGDMNASPTPSTTSADATAMSAGAPASGPITDTDFYQQALSGGEKEIAASKMAEKSSNAKVKELAKTIIADHTALGDKVKAAAGKSAPTPATPDTSELSGKTGADLDKAYVDMMVSDHQKDIPMFENASKNASTDKAKQLASAALPKLKKHLDMAQKTQASLK